MVRGLIICIVSLFFCQLIFAQDASLLNSFEEYKNLRTTSPYHLKARSVGPVLNSARAEAAQIDPRYPGTMYVAYGSGNLWKTTDNGLSWKVIFDDQASHGIGDFAIALSDPDIIYLGTGESLRKRRNYTLPGTGIYKSIDGGKSWINIGLNDSWHIGEIAIHPQNPDIVFVAVMGKFWTPSDVKGIYRTKDGGATWEKVFYVDEDTRANDVVIAPSNPDVVYASMWGNNANEDLMESVYGPTSSIYKSIDGGDTWTKARNGLPDGDKTGRMGIAVSYQDEHKLYANVDNLNKDRELAAEVYKSLDGGATWNRTHRNDLKFSSVIGWYFSDIYINPQNDEDIYALGVRLMRSQNGGKDFTKISGNVRHINPSAADHFHLDQCELLINPENPNNLFACNDGGLYQSYDSGQNWIHYNNIPAGEFYTITINDDYDYLIYGGTQDDATVYGPAKEFNPKFQDPWKYLWVDAWSGGDGCVTLLDPEDKNTIYFSMQNGAARRMDFEMDTSVSIKPSFAKDDKRAPKFNFVAPYILSPHDSKTIYHGGNYLFKSINRGDNWTAISPDLSISKYPAKKSTAAGAIAESPIKKGLLYLGTDHGACFFSDNDGSTWTEVSKGIGNGYIQSIEPSRFDTNKVYMTMSGLNQDDLSAYIYKSENNGIDWTPINSNLPNEVINVILEDPFTPGLIYCGSHRAVYVSHDDGLSWNMLCDNLPAVPIADLAISKSRKELVIATHGRGIYVQPLFAVYQLLAEKENFKSDDKKLRLYMQKSLSAPKRNNTHKDIDEHSIEKLDVFYYSDSKTMVKLTIKNEKDDIIFTKELRPSIGLNQFRWEMVLSESESNAPYFIHHKKYIAKGSYIIQLERGNQKQQQSFKLH